MCFLWIVGQGLLSEAEFQVKENPFIECSDIVRKDDTVWQVLVQWEHEELEVKSRSYSGWEIGKREGW